MRAVKGFSMAAVLAALIFGVVLAFALIRFGLGDGSAAVHWENLRIPVQLDGDYITALALDAETGEVLTGFESGHAASTAKDGTARFIHGHEHRVDHITASPKGGLVATSASETVLWDRDNGEMIATLEDVHGPVIWSESGDALFVIKRGEIKVYDVAQRRFHTAETRCSGSATALALDTRNDILAAGSSTGRVCLWKVLESGQYRGLDLMIESPESDRRNWVKAMAFSDDELLVITGREGIWRLKTEDLSLVQAKSPELTRVTHALVLNKSTGAVAMTGRIESWEGEEDHFVELFNLTTGRSEIIRAKTSTMSHLAASSDRSQLIVGNVVKYLLLDVPEEFR